VINEAGDVPLQRLRSETSAGHYGRGDSSRLSLHFPPELRRNRSTFAAFAPFTCDRVKDVRFLTGVQMWAIPSIKQHIFERIGKARSVETVSLALLDPELDDDLRTQVFQAFASTPSLKRLSISMYFSTITDRNQEENEAWLSMIRRFLLN